MEYYIISIFASIIIFIIIQYAEYNKYKNNLEENQYQEPFNLFKISNILLFMIIYLVFTIGFFYLKPSIPSLLHLTSYLNMNKQGGNKNKDISNTTNASNNTNKTDNTTNNNEDNNNEKEDEIDPLILGKITDNFDTGFAPFNSDDDNENNSTLSSISSDDDE